MFGHDSIYEDLCKEWVIHLDDLNQTVITTLVQRVVQDPDGWPLFYMCRDVMVPATSVRYFETPEHYQARRSIDSVNWGIPEEFS